jgi:hypothetical protein
VSGSAIAATGPSASGGTPVQRSSPSSNSAVHSATNDRFRAMAAKIPGRARHLCPMKRGVGLLLLLGVALLVFFITREVYRPAPPTEQVESTVLLERIRPVMKLVTVEGDLSEVFTYADNSAAWFDWTKDRGWNRKQAILLVKARASVGYDLEGLGLEFDEATRTVRFKGMGEPKLLSLEHDVKYFDLEEGVFAEFSAADHTKMNAMAKERIQRKVEAVVENAGWTFVEGDGSKPVAQ